MTTAVAVGTTAQSHDHIHTFASGTNCPRSERRGIPMVIDKDQLYYWSRLWREGVREAEDALANGDFVTFDSDDPNDVAHWLFEVGEG